MLGILLAQALVMSDPNQVFPQTIDKLPNGLTIVTAPVHTGAAVAYYTLVRAGSRD
jgi:predicted Zn-dependent peptidase